MTYSASYIKGVRSRNLYLSHTEGVVVIIFVGINSQVYSQNGDSEMRAHLCLYKFSTVFSSMSIA